MRTFEYDGRTSDSELITTKVIHCSAWEEWLVKLYVNGIYQPESTYFTDDKVDAYETAQAMVKDYKP